MAHGKGERRRIKTADNIVEIMDYIDKNHGLGVSEIACRLDLSKSTVHEYLYTLTDRGYLVNLNGQYFIGLRVFEHGSSARRRYGLLSTVEPGLRQLTERVEEAAWFIVEEHGYAYYYANAMTENAVRTHGTIGKREYLHCLSAGKVILAHLPESKVYEIIERRGLPEKTTETITDPDELVEELKKIRQRGHAFNIEEAADSVFAIAVPVFGGEDEVVGGLCVSGPASRMRQKNFKTEFPNILQGVADEIKVRLEWE